MKILIGKTLRDYESYKVDRDKFLRTERENLKKEKEKVKDKFKAFCKDENHNFVISTDEYGEVSKVCTKCPMAMRIKYDDY